MNTYTRIALAAGLLAAPLAPTFAQNGTPLTGVTSPVPNAKPDQAVQQKAHTMAEATKTPMAKSHHATKAKASPVSAPVSPTTPTAPKSN